MKTPRGAFDGHLTVRGILIGAAGSVIITTSSMYVALRLGALPWPTVFVSILSLAVLRALGGTNVNEISVTHTGMSAGAMVAGGLAFTLPAIWFLNPKAVIPLWPAIGVAVGGTILGIVFTIFIRAYFIEKRSLPYPIGYAAYETISTSYAGGTHAPLLFGSIGFAAVFTALRDWLHWIPGVWIPKSLASRGVDFGVWLSLLALGIGYLIGPLFIGVWFLGAIIGHLLVVPVGTALGLFANLKAAGEFRQSLGLGLMIGTGIGILLKGIIPNARDIYGSTFRSLFGRGSDGTHARPARAFGLPILLVAVVFVLTVVARLPVVPAILIIVGVWLTTSMSALITGQTGVNPMEVFGILVLLGIRLIWQVNDTEAVMVAAVVAVSCGLTGDVLNDFKSGFMFGTRPAAQMIAEAVGGLIGAVVAVFVLFALHQSYGQFGGSNLPAPQAAAVAALVGGVPNQAAFFAGGAVGLVLYLANVPAMTLGLGVYLPMFISTTAFLGGLARFIVRRAKPAWEERGTIVSSGFLGGEGIAGVTIAIVRMFTGG